MKLVSKILLFLIIPLSLSGHSDITTDQYVLNPLLINPAFAGSRKALNISSFYRRNPVINEQAPQTITLTLDAPFFNEKAGLGFITSHDKVGTAMKTSFMFDGVYKLNMGYSELSFGLGAGLAANNTEWLILVGPDEPGESSQVDSRLFVFPNLSFGVYYSYHNLFAGFSIPKFLRFQYNYNENRGELSYDPSHYRYLLYAGYLVDISRGFKFSPSTLLSHSSGGNLLYDLNAYFKLFDRFWLGVSYRDNQSVSGLFQLNLGSRIKVAYSYDFNPDEFKRYIDGSHEIMLRYAFQYKANVTNSLIF